MSNPVTETIGQFLKVRNLTDFRTMRFDVVSQTEFYIGFSSAGANESDSVWQVRKYIADPSGDVVMLWADGDTEFDNVWSNRASLSYL